MIAWAMSSYLGLLLFASTWWTIILGAVSLGWAIAGIGFCVMHDGNHGAMSTNGRVNLLAAATLDVIGGSSYYWHYKHNILHHTYTNIDGIDDDIDTGGILRLASSQPLRRLHRYQHLYELPVLGLLAPKWHFIDDWLCLARGRIGQYRVPRPRGAELAQLVGGKLFFYGWAIVIPLLLHPAWVVALTFALVSMVLGMTLGIVFQLAHVSADVPTHVPAPNDGRLDASWFEHQVATTLDFAPESRWLSWYVGGLNYQIEHHLFPRVSHIHYPAVSRIVRAACAAHGVEHRTQETLLGALTVHFRRLRQLGLCPEG